jgi:hypothetical protein
LFCPTGDNEQGGVGAERGKENRGNSELKLDLATSRLVASSEDAQKPISDKEISSW